MDEWTLDQARKHWQPMTRAVQHVGVPGYQFQAGVLWDGGIVFGPLGFRDLKVMQEEIAPLGNNLLHVSIGFGERMYFADRQGAGVPGVERWLEDGRLPIPHVQTADGDLSWHEVVFAHLLGRGLSEGMNPQADDTLVVHARFSVRNNGYSRSTGHLWLHFGDTSHVNFGYKCRVNEDVAPAVPQHYDAPYGVMDGKVRYVLPAPAKGKLRWHDSKSASYHVMSELQKVIEWEINLAPGEEAELRLMLPYGLVERSAGEQIAGLDSDKELAAVRSFWKKLQYGPGQITTPDSFVNDYLVAVAGQMAEQVAYRLHSTKVWMYKTSPNHYEGIWPCNASKAMPVFDLRGLTHIQRPLLQSIIDCQSDDVRNMDKGVGGHDDHLQSEGFAKVEGFMGDFGEWTANPMLASHGMNMWMLASHYRITRDDAWLRSGAVSPLQAMISAFDWAAVQRRRTMREVNGKRVPHWGLMPGASAHDWLAGNAIHNDVFVIFGMIEVVRLLREIKHERAEEMAAELNDYRACLHACYTAARDSARPLPLADGTTIPFSPRMIGELDWAQPDWTYTGYGPTRAGAWGALEPDDPLVDQALAYLDAGMPRGEGFSMQRALWEVTPPLADRNFTDVDDPRAQRHYMWRHYVEYETMWPMGGPLFLARDDLPRFFEFLAHNLAVVLHRDWRVGVESLDGVPSCAPGDGERWQIIRRMFVNERGGYDGSEQELFLLQAMPREWMKPGYRIAVKDMATWFGGRINLAVEVADDGNAVKVKASLSRLTVAPKQIRMRLRSGDGRPLASAQINGSATPVLPGDTIMLPRATTGEYLIEGRF